MVTNAALKPVETVLLCLVLSLGVMLPVYAEEPWRPETAAAVGRTLAIAEPSEGENSVASFGGVQVEVRPVVAAASPCDVTLPQRLPRAMSALVGDSAHFNALEGLKARLAQLSESSYGVSTKNAGLEAAKNDPIITEGITGYAANSWSGTSGGTYGFGNQHTQLSTPNGQQSDMNAQRSTPFAGSDDGRLGEFPWCAFQMLYDPSSNPMEQVRAFATRRNEVYSTLLGPAKLKTLFD